MSALRKWSLAVIPIASFGIGCSNVQLPNAVDSAIRGVKISKDVKALSEAQAKCSKLRAQDVVFEEERAIGETAAINIAAENGGLYGAAETADPKNAPVKYLNKLGRELADRSERPNLTWTFAIVDSPEVNAFSTPGGLVLVTRGLMQKVENEAQLAGVLAHEIGHVTERHALNRYRVFKETACNNALLAKEAGKAAAGVASNSRFLSAIGSDVGYLDFSGEGGDELLDNFGAQMAKTLQTEKFDPAAEKQADYDAVTLMIAAGYQPGEYVKLLQSLPDSFQAKTHPPKLERVENVESALKLFADPKENPLRAAGAPFGKAQGFKAPPIAVAIQSPQG